MLRGDRTKQRRSLMRLLANGEGAGEGGLPVEHGNDSETPRFKVSNNLPKMQHRGWRELRGKCWKRETGGEVPVPFGKTEVTAERK